MIPEESVAYAIATWARFNDSVSDELLRALAGAFVLVAAADGELARPEVDRFLEILRSKADVFSAIDFTALETTFRDLCEAMFADPEDGKRLALDGVARVRQKREQAELVTSAAEIAAAADGRLRSIEGLAVQEIRDVLGLEG